MVDTNAYIIGENPNKDVDIQVNIIIFMSIFFPFQKCMHWTDNKTIEFNIYSLRFFLFTTHNIYTWKFIVFHLYPQQHDTKNWISILANICTLRFYLFTTHNLYTWKLNVLHLYPQQQDTKQPVFTLFLFPYFSWTEK